MKPIEKILFLDIETVRESAELITDSEEYTTFQYKHRDRETGDFLEDATLKKLYAKTAGLSPVYSKTACVTVGVVRQKVLYLKNFSGDEKTILENVYSSITVQGLTPCAYNSIKFDMPYIRLRALKLGVAVPPSLSDSMAKPWELSEKIMDLLPILQGTFAKPFSLAEMCFLCGIPTSKDDIDGSEVSDVFYNEGVDRVIAYCNKDVEALARLFAFTHGFEITGVVDLTPKKKTIFETITQDGTILEESKAKILIEAKKLTAKEKNSYIDILKASLGANDVEVHAPFFKSILKIAKA